MFRLGDTLLLLGGGTHILAKSGKLKVHRYFEPHKPTTYLTISQKPRNHQPD